MKIPKTINICGTVFIIRELDATIKVGITKESWGYIDYQESFINIYSKLEEQKKFKVLIHEIIHGCCEAANIDITEKENDTLANILSDTLIRNNLLK